MNIRLGIYLLLIVAGLVVLAWPEEDDQMMIQFSETHGPSSLDVAGIIILLGGYVPLILPAITKFSMIQQAAGSIFLKLLIIAAIICLLLIGVALTIGSDVLLWVAVTISTVAQATLIYFARQKIV